MVSSVTNNGSTPPTASSAKGGLASLGSGDFLKLMTAQMQQQDPFSPMDNKDMLAQMAQFSSLASTAEMGDTLKAILAKLDAILTQSSPAPATDGSGDETSTDQTPSTDNTILPQE